jgi:hypothetical protein
LKKKPFARQLKRVRKLCLALPDATEKISHGEPTFFVRNKVYVMLANNHHNDGRIAVWLAAPPGFQEGLIEEAPKIFFRPPYVGTRGWLGIDLDQVSDADLQMYIQIAWELIAPKRLRGQRDVVSTAQKANGK